MVRNQTGFQDRKNELKYTKLEASKFDISIPTLLKINLSYLELFY